MVGLLPAAPSPCRGNSLAWSLPVLEKCSASSAHPGCQAQAVRRGDHKWQPAVVCAAGRPARSKGGSSLADSGEANGANGLADDEALEKQKRKRMLLDNVMQQINKDFGSGTVTRLGDDSSVASVEFFPSGCLSLDRILSGGLPKGRIIEIFGPESSGKTTLAMHAIAQVQRAGGFAVLVDVEQAFDREYARSLGINVDELYLSQPNSGEEALEVTDRCIRSGAAQLIVVDSVSALAPQAEIEGAIGMQQIGMQARLMSQSLRKLNPNAAKSGCTVIFINQIRIKVGQLFGNPETTSGGVALKFYASVRLDVRRGQVIKSPKGDEDLGMRVKVKVVKSKVSNPYRATEFDIMFGAGISHLGCVVDCADELGIVSKKGSWYSYGDQKFGQGRDRAIEYLRATPDLALELEERIRQRFSSSSNGNVATTHDALDLTLVEDDVYDDDFIDLEDEG